MLNKTYYQPVFVWNVPKELWDFQVFKTYEDAYNWLIQHDYDADQWDIMEYHDKDIEGVTFIDEYGDEMEKIEDLTDDEICDIILDEIVGKYQDSDNIRISRNDGESDQEFEDRLWTTAHDLVMNAIEKIEKEDEYDFSAYWDGGENAWYDRVREVIIRRMCRIMLGEEDW